MPSEAERREIENAVDLGWRKWEEANCHESGCGCVTEWIKREIRHALAAAPTPASRDDAVRLVDRMTCPGCGNNEPVEQIAGYEAHRYTNVICRRKGRAIIAALAEKGLLR